MRGRGPLARTVADGALLLDVMASAHPRDPFSVPSADVNYRAAVDRPIDDLTVGYTPDFGIFPVDPRVREITAAAADRLSEAGATVRRVDPDLDHTREELQDAYFTGGDVGMAELAETLQTTHGIDLLADHADDLDDQILAAIRRGRETSAVDYRRADVVRTALFDTVQDLFGSVDLLALPTLACPPFEHGTWGPGTVEGEAVDPRGGWVLTWPFNMTGHPASSVPAGLTEEGLPVGLQLVGQRLADGTVLAASAALERVSPWADAYPPGAATGP
jgi:aspartyl-tRNA(Asn)/glutamyl-tRNA(Gln) amidotransferase subunit A